jgi:ABC-type sulfate transport system substrate-binding protein
VAEEYLKYPKLSGRKHHRQNLAPAHIRQSRASQTAAQTQSFTIDKAFGGWTTADKGIFPDGEL